ncbi:hypothetical protein LCGC14_3007990 [marine sediment metagenome]|uniref:Uncharacterized protein n=1 Tax=marine sediment metagenome TaxID=412755 RepID=A0A0F8WZJ0_9ZZZZ
MTNPTQHSTNTSLNNLKFDPLLEFLWRNNSSLRDFDDAVRHINKSTLRLKIKRASEFLMDPLMEVD